MTNGRGSRRGAPVALGPLPTNPGNLRGFRWIAGRDSEQGAPRRGAGVPGGGGGAGRLQSQQPGKYFRGTCNGGRFPAPGGWNPPLPRSTASRGRPEEAGGGRRGRGRDLGPGGSAGGHEGAYYRLAEPGFQKFLLVSSGVAPRREDRTPTLERKPGTGACWRNRAHGVLRSPSSPES